MGSADPQTDIDPRFSTGTTPLPWPDAIPLLKAAEMYWISTVRSDGRPHVTPLAAVWQDDALYFCTGPTERKARNLEHNRNVILTTGGNRIREGTDLVIEGEAERVTDEPTLQRLADAYLAKYGDIFGFSVRDGAFHSGDGGTALVFEVSPRKGFACGKGDAFSQTRWRF
jgi:uncharacterized pyridoxamine 5'-phosphate oxidase family protein